MSQNPDISGAIITDPSGNVMTLRQMAAAIRAGTPVTCIPDPGAECTLQFPSWGDCAYRIVPRQGCQFRIAGGENGQLQKMRVMLIQPPGGNCEMTWPDEMIWPSGSPFVDTRSGSVTCVEIFTDGSGTYYGGLIFG